ncbi:hypothetical protein MSG28_012273 [Choristoneura fumiferana]|uniref:Uncharacterized protein n=1 Tax=Choristoneura fumiferana TaxID=7141 RepID=A0ACC0KCB3_CHOFU|nr:hypothetical protein MSG28_012273 [Choristoneura fumiferana]
MQRGVEFGLEAKRLHVVHIAVAIEEVPLQRRAGTLLCVASRLRLVLVLQRWLAQAQRSETVAKSDRKRRSTPPVAEGADCPAGPKRAGGGGEGPRWSLLDSVLLSGAVANWSPDDDAEELGGAGRENIDFPKEEEKILQFWKDIDAFASSLKQSKNKPRYSFYDGPPFATGLPHYGHILAGTIKDVGYYVERRFGWDCHGLPVEYEIDKTLGIKGPDDVEKMGIDKYNAECRKIVMRYANDWESIITRMGRWIDGQKMSKRKKNYPDPLEVVNKYGADALRLYLVNSPVVKAENLRFKEEGVRDVIKDVFLPWYNAFRFLMQNVERIIQEDKINYKFNEKNLKENVMDKWISSFTQSLITFVKQEMAAYKLYTVVPRLTKFIDHLTNWYVRMNRKRLKGEFGVKDCQAALDTLFGVLFDMIRVMAPYTPFLTENMYKTLRQLLPGDSLESVHFNMIPEPKLELIDTNIERAVQRMQTVIELGRVLRDRKTIPIKYPLPEMIVIHRDPTYLDDVKSLDNYVLEEMNVKQLQLTSDKEKYGITLRAEPDHKILGARLKGDFKAVTQGLKNLNNEQCEKLIADGFVEIVSQRINVDEVRIIFQATGNDQYEAHSDNDVLILLNVTPDQDMLDEGFAREIINRVQKLRKKGHLVPTDEVNVYYEVAKTSDISRIINSHREFIETTVKAPLIPSEQMTASKHVIIQETQELKGSELKLIITWRKEVELPSNPWANIALQGLTPRFGATSNQASIILTDKNNKYISLTNLYHEVEVLFGLYGIKFTLWCDGSEIKNTNGLNAKTVVVSTVKPKALDSVASPFCKFVNVSNGSKASTVFLENPVGKITWNKESALKFASDYLGISVLK